LDLLEGFADHPDEMWAIRINPFFCGETSLLGFGGPQQHKKGKKEKEKRSPKAISW
jgi:hypothetical protein